MRANTAYSLSLLPLVWGKTIDVTVGNGGLVFSPSIVTADVGDKVDFHFFPKNHSVVQSSFQAPCVPIKPDEGIFSGFQPTKAESPNVFEVTVNDTKPIWIYCAQAKHCETGMSMVINEPKNANTLAAYQAAAKDVPASSSPPDINGGIFITSTNTTSSANSTYTSTSPPSNTASNTATFTGGASAIGNVAELGAAAFVAAGMVLFQM